MSTKTILLVEDNPDDEALALRAFEKSHFSSRIVVAHNGAEALDYLFATGQYESRNPSMPRLILLDLKLPKVDGFEVLKAIRADERTKLLPVVIHTSSKEVQDIINSYSWGANSYVPKQIDFSEFIETVRQLERYWLGLNEPPPVLAERYEGK